MIQFQGFPSLEAPEGFVRAWYFEPFVAAASFFFWIHVYWWAERQQGASRINDIRKGFEQPVGYSLYSILSYSAGIYAWKMFIPPPAPTIPDGVPTSINELGYLTLEVVSGIVFYDFLFFFIHWGMHEIPLLRQIHHHHHAMKPGTVEARDVVHHSLMDGTLQVLVNIFIQRHTMWGSPKSRFARILHNILVTWMLTESHSASTLFQFWRRFLVGVREHRLHHLYDHRSRATWIQTTTQAEEANNGSTTKSKTSMSTTNKRKFDRHQQFFGYLDDLRFWYSEWKASTRLTDSRRLR